MHKEKLFYLHIPKTGGSSLNHFLTSKYHKKEYLLHIESNINLESKRDVEKAKNIIILSGHIPLPQAHNLFNIFDSRTIITLFRNPLTHIVSHLTWVRKLGDPGEEDRLSKHTKQIQKIVQKLSTIDMSSAKSLNEFIKWLEEEKIFLFHDTQTRYLCGSPLEKINPFFLNIAMKNLDKLDYIGIMERYAEFTLMLSYHLGFDLFKKDSQHINKNSDNYGLDINNPEIRESLQQLIMSDSVIYRLAREKFINTWHDTLKTIELNTWSTYSSISLPKIQKEMEKYV